MRAIDTNVLVRLFTSDSAEQCEAAERYIAEGAWVPTIAVVEAAWVLKGYGMKGADLTTVLEMLLSHETLVLQDHDLVARALLIFRERPSLSFADCVMLVTARQAGHLPLGTFDRALSRRDGAELIT